MLLRVRHGHSLQALGLAAAALGFLLVGCSGPLRGDKAQQTSHEVAVAPADQTTAAADNADSKDRPVASNKTTNPPARQAGDVAPSTKSPPRDALDEGRVVSITPSGATITRVGPEEPAYPSEEDLERRREEASDMIYALIRVRMEEAIIKRKDLLEGGTANSDVEVRRLENVIMNARQYLEENGEIVEPVDPPIVQTLRPSKRPVRKDRGNLVP